MRNFILSTFFALFLHFIAASAQEPPPGTYYIFSSVLSPAGDKLAATFDVAQSNVIVTPLNNSAVQRWTITLGEQFIVPVDNPSVAATAAGNDVVILPKNSFVWTISNIASGSAEYVIADQSQLWDLDKVADKANIVLKENTGSQTQKWVLQLV